MKKNLQARKNLHNIQKQVYRTYNNFIKEKSKFKRNPFKWQEVEPSKEKVVEIEIRGQTLQLDNAPLCTFTQLVKAIQLVERKYPLYLSKLPENHPWKEEKVKHSIAVEIAGNESLGNLYRQLKEENYFLIQFMSKVHDIGRAIEARIKLGLKVPKRYEVLNNHGQMSTKMLEEMGALQIFPTFTQEIICHSIEQHDVQLTPMLRRNPKSKDISKYFFTALLRDKDKLGCFDKDTKRYLYDKDSKRDQILLYKHIRGERGKIEPENHLDEFTKFKVPDRDKSGSYEGWMLLYLAWIFDMNFQQILQESVDVEAIGLLLQYLEERLRKDDAKKIKRATISYLENKGIKVEGLK